MKGNLTMTSRKMRLTLKLLVAAVFVSIATLPLHAQIVRAFVGSTGNDTNACSRVAPCRTLTAAVASVTAGGEVIVLDSAAYGPVSITKSVSIIAPRGIYASVDPPGASDSIAINAPGGTVAIRGLTLNGYGIYGIDVIAAGSIHVDDCLIRGFTLNSPRSGGLGVQSGCEMFVSNTVFLNNFKGIQILNSSGAVTAWVDACRIEESGYTGIDVLPANPGTATLIVTDTAVTNSFYQGLLIGTGGDTTLKNCVVTGSTSAIHMAGGSISLSRCLVDNNNIDIEVYVYGPARSFGNNAISQTYPSLTPVALQ
jgi:parallel beta helix pectate lyase-like protein